MTHVKRHCIRFKCFVSAVKFQFSFRLYSSSAAQMRLPMFVPSTSIKFDSLKDLSFWGRVEKNLSSGWFPPPKSFQNLIVSALWELIFPLATRQTNIDEKLSKTALKGSKSQNSALERESSKNQQWLMNEFWHLNVQTLHPRIWPGCFKLAVSFMKFDPLNRFCWIQLLLLRNAGRTRSLLVDYKWVDLEGTQLAKRCEPNTKYFFVERKTSVWSIVVQAMSLFTTLKQQRWIVNFLDSCSVELPISSGDRIGVIYGILIQVNILTQYSKVGKDPGY